MVDKHTALAREEIIEALTSYSGVTTADGATPANNTLVDSNLIGENDFLSGKAILIGSGVDASYEDKAVDSFDNVTGEITVSAAFSAQIKQGTPFRVLNASSGGVVSTLLNDIKAQTNKLAGETPGEDEVTANWESGTATSGEAGADLVNIGTAGDRKKLHSLVVSLSALTVGATITIKLFMLVNGADTKVYPPVGTTWVVGTDPDGIWVVDGTVEISGALRVEVQSDNAGDNGKAITYKYETEDM